MRHLFPDPRPVQPLTLAEARCMITDPQFARQFDDLTRSLAWRMVKAAQRGVVVRLVVISNPQSPTPPKDAA